MQVVVYVFFSCIITSSHKFCSLEPTESFTVHQEQIGTPAAQCCHISGLIMPPIYKENRMDNMEETGKHATVLVRPTVMVVDDADEMLMIMESILAKEYSLKLFNNPKEALDYASSNPPDLILLDVMMPEIEIGRASCRERV